ncbi:Uncharacterised protein [[Clostridium] sordellii]|uniref:Uncharacterized protein n=1 Tax=Paraclostridium sordellii TaxID=1505 RepID=A0ABM9RTN7_PARSO|nr:MULTISPECIES: hypothetical protein [Clostridia]MDU4415245.1 hypothetical protein [Paeniclostridium sordellii]MDU4477963.1 hypothetical protein [Clostridium sp.]MRZ27974.1 hypothetical protein [Paeniclostridium sordellii]CEJ75453.1 hypothetical protein ATCC9714_PCS200461 (plasmid) [[Clostridium] sordellii] [Paeniclostridium sordellii]CEN67995.1 Uncharacterised protein [[Clostridium] sordellii] [Paeniclostridium sordellii]
MGIAKYKNTNCLFAVDGKVCTHKNICDKEACSTRTLLKGYSKCVFLYPKEKAKEFLKENK